ncbi:MAG: sulfatase-like hydrolase/transferase [Actinomycetes bacterium]
MNVLFVTLDQLRADVVSDPLVKTPTLDAIRAEGVFFARHYAQATPCAPGRAALYTGTYQSNNRVVANGTPLDARFDNVALLARRAGFDPTLFGYTDQGLDPRQAMGPNDPRLDYYDGILPGFSEGLRIPEDQRPWRDWLESKGYDPGSSWVEALAGEPTRPEELSLATFLTNAFLGWLAEQPSGWFAHVSHLRPHSPYAAAGSYSTMYDPADCCSGIVPSEDRHPLHEAAMSLPISAAPATEKERSELRAQYYGMVSEVDAQLGRVVEALKDSGQWESTIVVITADHGDQLGDHGLIEKLGFFEESYRIPLIIRDPRSHTQAGSVIERFTESVDVMPTLALLLDQEVPAQCDGMPLQPFLSGVEPPWWRSAAHYEWDWRFLFIDERGGGWPQERFLERQNLAVLRDEKGAYVHFGDGSWLLFDLEADPTWRTTTDDPSVVLRYAQAMLSWRQEHLDRDLTNMLLTPERLGRWPGTP